ncbi:hypothetical protein SA46CTH2_6 [Staphylococcus phage SA46-CTH2]|nr:hypothetical protein SA46CTH2_6 [Staphylococcus phage SA46-CTH2]QEM41189.1 hypothetical protein SA44CTH7_6 [Staphylococcus phage SA44-CTH7]
MRKRMSQADRWKKEREARKEEEEKIKLNDFSDISFKFEDEALQKEYIDAWKYFSKLTFLPKEKHVSYVNAVSLVRGKRREQLLKILNIYERNDDSNNKNAKTHKYTLYDETAKDNNTSMYKYIKGIEELFDEIGKADRPKTTIDDKEVRYNFLYYHLIEK